MFEIKKKEKERENSIIFYLQTCIFFFWKNLEKEKNIFIFGMRKRYSQKFGKNLERKEKIFLKEGLELGSLCQQFSKSSL